MFFNLLSWFFLSPNLSGRATVSRPSKLRLSCCPGVPICWPFGIEELQEEQILVPILYASTEVTIWTGLEATTTEKFSAVAYPNPATEGFKVKSSNGKSFGVQVYDMLGRSIEQRQMSSDAQIGSNYAKGIYNVIVNQGANVKTLRVIKQ